MPTNQNRRNAIKNIMLGSTAIMASAEIMASCSSKKTYKKNSLKSEALKGNLKHAVCRWCYNEFSLDDLCAASQDMGLKGIDLVGPKDWPTLKKYNLDSSMCNGAEISLTEGWNDKQYHPTLIKNYTEYIDLVAQAGYKNLICFSGSRKGMDNETGWKNCTEGLKQVMAQAEKKGVILQMELLNSKVNHKDNMCDRTDWGVELCKRIGSPNFKLLYDIYHMQIDEGDVIRTINDNHQYLGHYHTGGVPGRNEIDETQELYYPAIMKAIIATGYNDFVAQEFIPLKSDKLASLKAGVLICDV
jgi:hydroxypyruvate isomerase